jgi:transcriptional regulator with XRE-family HTH domain
MPRPFAPFPVAAPRTPTTLHERMRMVVGGRSFAAVSRATGFNDETVRRYLSGGRVSVDFIIALAERYGVSADWLLLGRGHPDGRRF